MSEPLLKIPNHHAATCGDPPFDNGEESQVYIGYFENEHGEQWIFIRDRKTGIATLRSGDIGWNTPVSVIDGIIETLTLNPCEAVAGVLSRRQPSICATVLRRSGNRTTVPDRTAECQHRGQHLVRANRNDNAILYRPTKRAIKLISLGSTDSSDCATGSRCGQS